MQNIFMKNSFLSGDNIAIEQTFLRMIYIKNQEEVLIYVKITEMNLKIHMDSVVSNKLLTLHDIIRVLLYTFLVLV